MRLVVSLLLLGTMLLMNTSGMQKQGINKMAGDRPYRNDCQYVSPLAG